MYSRRVLRHLVAGFQVGLRGKVGLRYWIQTLLPVDASLSAGVIALVYVGSSVMSDYEF